MFRQLGCQAIYCGVLYNDTLEVIEAKTGYGKSLVALAISTMRRGVSIIHVPLHGFGADEVLKAMHVDRNIEAWHVDEFRGVDWQC